MIANKKFWRPLLPSVGSRCPRDSEIAAQTSLLQILAAADLGDAEDMAIREILFVALRDLGAEKAAVTRPDARGLRAPAEPRQRRRTATRNAKSFAGARRPICPFRQ